MLQRSMLDLNDLSCTNVHDLPIVTVGFRFRQLWKIHSISTFSPPRNQCAQRDTTSVPVTQTLGDKRDTNNVTVTQKRPLHATNSHSAIPTAYRSRKRWPPSAIPTTSQSRNPLPAHDIYRDGRTRHLAQHSPTLYTCRHSDLLPCYSMNHL
jgi:hypothetical protein